MTSQEASSAKYVVRVFAYLRGPVFAIIENPEEHRAGAMPALGASHGPLNQTVLIPVSDGMVINVSPIEEDKRASPSSPLLAWFDIEADTPASELSPEVETYLDELTDQLGFLWDYPVAIYDLSLIDITPPAVVGESRSTLIIPNYRLPKHRSTAFLFQDEQRGAPNFEGMAEPVRAALRWYSAATVPQPDAQRFVALWIALEILARHKVEVVRAPYVAPCSHAIANCPECGKSTLRSVEGERMKSYLQDHLGANKANADTLWKVRQLVHGRHRFRPKDVATLTEATGTLWTMVRQAIGAELGFKHDDGPVAPQAILAIELYATRLLKDEDLTPGAWTQPVRTKPSIRLNIGDLS